MHYDYIAIPEKDIPRAANPLFQHLLDIYAGETDKVISVWRGFGDEDLGFRPHPKSSTVADNLKHQLLSERRFFGEFVGTPEPPADQVLPQTQSVAAYMQRMEELAGPSPARVLRGAERRLVDGGRSLLRAYTPAHLDLLAPRASHLPPPHAVDRVSPSAE